MEQFSRLFSIPLQILCRFLALSQLPAFLKAYKNRHISFIKKDDQIPSFTSKKILYFQEYLQPVGDLILLCNTFRMLVLFCDAFYALQAFYYAPSSKDRGHIVLPLSVRPSVSLSAQT